MTTAKGRRGARRSEAVAEEAPAPAAAEPTSTARRCCDRETVAVTDGIAAEAIAYCELHRPVNLR
jgi:hypothetical protein